MTKDLTTSPVDHQNVLNNSYALEEIQKATQLNDLNSEHFVFVPGIGTLKHMVHRGDFSLQYLECTKCKKVFRISPEQTKTMN